MELGAVRISRRRLVAGGACLVGLVILAVAVFRFGAEVGLMLLAAAVALVFLAIAVVYVQLRRHDRSVTAVFQEQALRAQDVSTAQREETVTLQQTVHELRWMMNTQLEAARRDQRRAAALMRWREAAQRRDQAGAPMQLSREAEIALVRGCDLFDPQWYRAQVGLEVADPAGHYVDIGAATGADPHRFFPATTYLERYPEALVGWRTPLAHYLTIRQEPGTAFEPAVVRTRRGTPDEDDLRWEYLVRGLHEEPDTFVLYRIIGNDLPPRHRPGQSLDNVRFILDHEPSLPQCQKRWVVNRIIDPRVEKQLVSLLEENGQPYVHIPFVSEDYRRVGWRFNGLPMSGFTYRTEFERLSPRQQQRVLDHVYHYKNLYVMNNNGSRNAALREGRSLAKWVLPWDGNCFLTVRAWEELVAGVVERPYLKYFTVPMARILDNRVLLEPAPIADASEEPQILFRRDATEEFDPDSRYGRRSKVELFYRLRLPGPWDTWGRVPWDAPMPAPAGEAGQFGQAGWVARLFSGQGRQESDVGMRQRRRLTAIRECLERVDEDQIRGEFRAADLFVLAEPVLARQREAYQAGEPGPARVVAELLTRAAQLPSRGSRSPAVMSDDVMVAALAGYFSRGKVHLRRGADLLRSWFIGRRAQLAPRRALAPGSKLDMAATVGFFHLVDAARLLEREAALTSAEVRALQEWFGAYQRWLGESRSGRAARRALDPQGTWYDLQAAAVAAYVDDVGGLLAALRRAYDRVGQQLGPDLAHATLPNLLGWTWLAGGAARVGQDLWSYQPPAGGGLAAAVRHVLGSAGMPAGDGRARRAVLAHLSAGRVAQLSPDHALTSDQQDPWAVRQIFEAGADVRPFWVLGSDLPSASV